MQFQAIAAQLDFLAWRDAQLSALSAQLEAAFPDLLDALSAQADEAGRWALVQSSFALQAAAEGQISDWASAQLTIALQRAEAELERALTSIPGQVHLGLDAWQQIAQAAPAIAGVGLIAASVAAIPTVISFATVSTSVFAFWGTAAVSWPLFTIGAIGVGVLALTGSKSLQWADTTARDNLRARLRAEAARQVFGLGERPGARCILSDIQAAVVQAGRNRILGERE